MLLEELGYVVDIVKKLIEELKLKNFRVSLFPRNNSNKKWILT